MTTLQYLVRAVDDFTPTFARMHETVDRVNRDLSKLDGKTATANAKLEDKQFKFELDDIELKMARLDKRVTTTHMNDDQIARARHEADRLSLALDKLNAKRTKIHVDSSALTKLSKASFLQPSLIGTAVALSPALIPLAGSIAGAVGAIGISFGAAGIAAGAFGLTAKSVLTNAGSDATKLATLQAQLARDTTAKQKAATRQQITALETGWSGAYKSLVTSQQQFTARWEKLSSAIATPALAAWFGALNKAIIVLRPALQPVADLFDHWGKAISRYFADPITILRVKNMAATFGNFAAIQLGQIAKFITDVAKAFFNLGRDLVDSGVKLGAAGTGLMHIGDAFLTWSKSAKARADVNGFLRFLHTEGPVVTGILRDLGKLLPGVFAGATTAGTLELKALGDFLNLVAKLPPRWQKGLTEAAGALLLMSKLGVLKVGLKIVGLGAKLLTGGTISLAGDTAAAEMRAAIVSGGAQAAAEIRAAMTGGAAGAAGGGAAGGVAKGAGIGAIAARARSLLVGIIADIGIPVLLANIFHLPGQKLSIFESDTKALRDDLRKTADSFKVDWHAMASSFDAFRHDAASTGHAIAHTWDTLRHDAATTGHNIAASWDTTRHDAASTGHAIAHIFDVMRHDIAHIFDVMRHDIATTWDAIWRNTVQRTRNGINDVIHWAGTLPGRIRSVFHGALTWLYTAGKNVIQGLWNGLLFIWNKVKNFVGSIAGWIKAHKGPIGLDAHLLEPAGRALMSGLHLGLLGGAKGPLGFISGLTGTIGSLLSKGLSSLFGGGGPGTLSLGAIERLWIAAGGPGGIIAHIAAAITGAEAGFRPGAVQQGQPYATTGWGLWQITPGNSEPQAGINAALLNPMNNAIAAVAKFRQAGSTFNPWTTFTSGAFAQFMDRGGWLAPGFSLVENRTGRPEHLVPADTGSRQRQGPLLHIEHLHVREAADVDLLARRLAFLDN